MLFLLPRSYIAVHMNEWCVDVNEYETYDVGKTLPEASRVHSR
jgi:hypothetical protein